MARERQIKAEVSRERKVKAEGGEDGIEGGRGGSRAQLVGWLFNVPATSQGRICSDHCTCCHTEIQDEDQTFHLTQSQYTDIGPTPGAWGEPIFKALI